MSTDAKNHLEISELENLLRSYLPEDVLRKVSETINELAGGEGREAFWAGRDRLTGLYNEQGLIKELESWKRSCAESGESVLFFCIDIERLKIINRTYGRSEGDVVIQTMGQILEDSIEDKDLCGHLGGGEFVVVMRATAASGQQAESFKRALNGRIGNYNHVSGKEYSFHVSFNSCVLEIQADSDARGLLDRALSGKRLQKSAASEDQQKERIDPEERRLVNEVIDQNKFRYAFQPIVDAATGDIVAYEALMRTQEGISLTPLQILRCAKLDGRLYDIERATFFNVMRQIAEGEGESDRKFFINSIPRYQLDQADYGELREKYGSLFGRLVVEITEQTELDDERLDQVLNRSKNDGFELAIDDYGTGYSNTSSLLRYVPNCVKIDRMLISEIQENPKKQHFVNNIITFAHDNGFLALAEGVETAAELKAVIHMGVDLIQGFYTAKPSFELQEKLSEELRNEIIQDNINRHGDVLRKIYLVNDEKELSVVQLALEQYTGIVVSQPELELFGNSSFPAGMSVKIKDGCSCRLTLRDVSLESIEDMPCIDIGNNAHLTLVLEGNNRLDKTGIRVPDGSGLHLEGCGNLTVFAKGIYCYGIGNDFNSGVGEIVSDFSGKLEISTEGNYCIAIGGGIYRQGRGIGILGGNLELTVAGVDAVGIGFGKGGGPIELKSCGMKIDFRVATGAAIGCLAGDQNVKIANMRLEIGGSGSHLCGVGSIGQSGGEISIRFARIVIHLTGQNVLLIGNEGGGLCLDAAESTLILNSEGSNVMGIGALDESAVLRAEDVALNIHLLAAENLAVGAKEENVSFVRGEKMIKINVD